MTIKTRLKALENRVIERRHMTLCCINGQYWQPLKADFSDVLHGFDEAGNPCAPDDVKLLTLAEVDMACRKNTVLTVEYFAYHDGMRGDIEPMQ